STVSMTATVGSRASATCCLSMRRTSSAWASSRGRRLTSFRSGRMAASAGSRVSPCWRSISPPDRLPPTTGS
ncbi:Putative formate dehydrogenase oxidoreductase protein, partial [Pseudomonas sp. FEN]